MMESVVLHDIEVRVLGCLVEKEATTPDYYPMTLNSLTAACNQKSNRDPVFSLDERDVVRALDSLRDKKLAVMISSAGGRVPKYEHLIKNLEELSTPQLAVLCTLMLRGAQTVGEIKTRCARIWDFESLEAVERALGDLADFEQPLAVKLPRRAGQKECRFTHLLAGEPEVSDEDSEPVVAEKARLVLEAENERIAHLESEVAELKTALAALQAEFEAFKEQFI